jgi:SHAQKYF class myb-like DNA-binding protein
MTSTLEDIELPELDVAFIEEVSLLEAVPTPLPVASNDLKQASPSRRPTVVTSAPPAAAAPSRSSGKSKKKKGQSQLTVANAPGVSEGKDGENTGRWTSEEHRLFLQGLEQHGKGWKKIASLIKSRTVVQIRTHAQKYFQKLAKARQNGEDEGAVTFIEGRGGAASVTSASTVADAVPRRRRQVVATGTKRKAIQSVVASAQRQGKKLAAASGVPNPMAPLPAIAPALAYFILPTSSSTTAPATASSDGIPAPGTISGPALEDSL